MADDERPARAARAEDDSVRKAWLPKPEDYERIKSITAESISCPLPGPDFGPFEIPRAYYEEILQYFHENEIDDDPNPAAPELGSLRINFEDHYVRLCWFWIGTRGRLCFSCRGVRYNGVGQRFAEDENLHFNSLIRLIYRKEVLHQKDVKIPQKSVYKRPSDADEQREHD